MTVTQLIVELQKMPPDAVVRHLWDGGLRTGIEFVWLTKGGEVATSDYGQYTSSDEEKPIDIPKEQIGDFSYSTPDFPDDNWEKL